MNSNDSHYKISLQLWSAGVKSHLIRDQRLNKAKDAASISFTNPKNSWKLRMNKIKTQSHRREAKTWNPDHICKNQHPMKQPQWIIAIRSLKSWVTQLQTFNSRVASAFRQISIVKMIQTWNHLRKRDYQVKASSRLSTLRLAEIIHHLLPYTELIRPELNNREPSRRSSQHPRQISSTRCRSL